MSLRLAQRLKKLGVGIMTLGQEALWHWYYDDANKKWDIAWYGSDDLIKTSKPIYAAFTASELGEMLPARIKSDEGVTFVLECWKNNTSWQVSYWWEEDTRHLSDMKIETMSADSEADCRAKMLIYLVENNLLGARTTKVD